MNRLTRLSLRIFLLCSMVALNASEAPNTTPAAVLAPTADKSGQEGSQNSLITSIDLTPIWHATKPVLSGALNIAQKYWPITLALTCVVFRKPIMNFIKGSIMSLIWGDAVAAIDTRTTAIQADLGSIRETAEALGRQIAALPEQQHAALDTQASAIKTRIEQLEKTAQDATIGAFESAQTQIVALQEQLTALSAQVTRDTAENQRRFTVLESGQTETNHELTAHRREMDARAASLQEAISTGASAIRSLDQRLALFEQHTAEMLCGIKNTVTGLFSIRNVATERPLSLQSGLSALPARHFDIGSLSASILIPNRMYMGSPTCLWPTNPLNILQRDPRSDRQSTRAKRYPEPDHT